MNNQNSIKFKIPIIGDTNVGKTCIIKKFLERNKFDLKKDFPPEPTISINPYIHYTTLDGKKLTIEFIDTMGQEKFKSIVINSLKGCHGLLIVFDLTEEESFDNIIYWVNQAKQVVNIDYVDVTMIGNKCDLERKVSKERIENFKKKNNLNIKFNYFETSAMTGEGIDDCMLCVVDNINKLYEKNKDNINYNNVNNIQLNNKKDENKSGCFC
jgi:small GTP-binding protein